MTKFELHERVELYGSGDEDGNHRAIGIIVEIVDEDEWSWDKYLIQWDSGHVTWWGTAELCKLGFLHPWSKEKK